MDALSLIILIFSVFGAVCYIFKDKFGINKEYERAFKLLGDMVLSMTGMIVISPLIADLISPLFEFVYNTLHLDPSVIPSSLFANDMGGAPLSLEVTKNPLIGNFNAFVVSSMMGCTVSFTIPVAMKLVAKKNHKQLILGLLCGVVTVPVGCFISGLFCKIGIISLIVNLIPIILLSVIIAVGLWFFPEASVKVFKVIGFIINVIVVLGLTLGIVNFLAGRTVIMGIATVEEGVFICMNAAIVMSGMFPIIRLLSLLLKKPLEAFGKKLSINTTSAAGLISSLATSMTTFAMTDGMDKKGIMLNSAFSVSGAFVFAGHLAFTMAYNSEFILPMIIGKLCSGVTAFILANIFCKKLDSTNK